ncbi:MAG TPA: cytochrome b/b6 domain-containing protein [Ramlibacter sp.]|nr:cytochrome b/b6 domain-containing protein [Ramlibacter sp.]
MAACLIALVVTGKIGGAVMDWHARFGYAVLTLLLFRLAWGFAGGDWSKFRSFLYAPASVLAHLRGRAHPGHLVGHNPLGALSVFAMLLVLLAQVATGLVGDDEIAFTGPLNRFVSSSQGLAATWYHKEVGLPLLLALVALHVGTVLFYVYGKRQDVLRPMIVGDKVLAAPAPASRDDFATRLGAAALLAIAAGLVAWLVGLGNP